MMRAAAVFAGLLAVAGPTPARDARPAPARQGANPLLPSGADPHLVAHDGWFHFMATRGDRLTIRRTRDLSRLAEAEEVTVWRPPATGPGSVSIWAPELHRIDGRWFIYYTAAERGHDDDAHRGVFVLENRAADPRRGTWIDRGRIATRLPGLDGTVFEVEGRRWFAYSAYDGPDSVLAVAPMRDPWTLAAPDTIIARPDQDWERQGGRQILEGPALLHGPRGDVFMAYSASACWSDDYALGLLRLTRGADPARVESWTKTPQPVLAKTPANGVYAPGHNGFLTDRAGGSWIVYHANARAGAGCGRERSPRIQRMGWTEDGLPVFPVPATGPAALPQP